MSSFQFTNSEHIPQDCWLRNLKILIFQLAFAVLEKEFSLFSQVCLSFQFATWFCHGLYKPMWYTNLLCSSTSSTNA